MRAWIFGNFESVVALRPTTFASKQSRDERSDNVAGAMTFPLAKISEIR